MAGQFFFNELQARFNLREPKANKPTNIYLVCRISGKQVKLTAIGNGGTGSYTYKFLICDDKENWYRIRDFGSSNTCTWTPGALGKKTLYVDVKDSSGVIIRQKLDITVK